MTRSSVLIPAHNEVAFLPACLEALLASDPAKGMVEVVVIANGCTDGTADLARSFEAAFKTKGWPLIVLDLAQGGKLNAWNMGEAAAQGNALIYLDADVSVSPRLIAQLDEVLDSDTPRYASGRPNVTTAGNWVTETYTRFWMTTPFMVHGVPGFGVFAMNRAGRARWADWPDIISDDTFARLSFTQDERLSVPATFDWPMIEGFSPLVQVRRRQDAGVAEIVQRYPKMMANDDVHDQTVPMWRRALRDPMAFVVFVYVRLAIRLPILRSGNRWARGR